MSGRTAGVVRGGIARRAAVASIMLAAVVGVAFVVVLIEITELRRATGLARHSERVLAAVNHLERLVIDLETGLRGFAITGDERFLAPLDAARRDFPDEARALVRLAAGTAAGPAGQTEEARRIEQAGRAYIDEYVAPTLDAIRRDVAALPALSGLLVPSPQTAAAFEEGKRRVDDLRARFDHFADVEADLAATRQEGSSAAARRATMAGSVGVAGSVVLVAFFAAYLLRVIVTPVRRAAAMAGRLAAGDLTVRMPEAGPGEIGELGRAFNTMAGSLHRLLDEQAALRRVATLVARGVAPADLFAAVMTEAHGTLDPTHALLVRYDPDGAFIAMAGDPGLVKLMPVNRRVPPEDQTVAAEVFRTGRAARVDLARDRADRDSVVQWAPGMHCAVGAPIVVEGCLWGAVIVTWAGAKAPQDDVEDRLTQFTDLVATAIANADSRTELAASRARVVAAGDEAHRRIERNLHDGVQQRLVALALDLRGLAGTAQQEGSEHREGLIKAGRTLAETIEDLREVSQGIHPAILSRGGLAAALRTLTRRVAVPVRLEIGFEDRLPEAVEAAGYYVVSEALTNAVKHARASQVEVGAHLDDGNLWLAIRDDGIGGADPARGSGLVGLRDRVEAIGGTIDISSPPGEGTTYFVKVPVEGR